LISLKIDLIREKGVKVLVHIVYFMKNSKNEKKKRKMN